MTYLIFGSAEKVRKDADRELTRNQSKVSTSQLVIVPPVLEDNAHVSTWIKRLPELSGTGSQSHAPAKGDLIGRNLKSLS